MKNMNGEELYDWMAVLDCQHVQDFTNSRRRMAT